MVFDLETLYGHLLVPLMPYPHGRAKTCKRVWIGWSAFASSNESWIVARSGSAKRNNLTARSRSTPSFVT